LSEIIKSRGIGVQKHFNYNDMIDEVYDKERDATYINLGKLDHAIRTESDSFSHSFKRSL
jgi:hypothetical protein